MARAAGDIFAGIVERAGRLAAFQAVLNAMWTPADQKRAVMDAHCHGLLTQEETTLLFEIYDLANA